MSDRQYVDFQEPERQIAFVLTERCNLRCIYCYEQHKNKNTRSLDAGFIVRKATDEMLADNEFRKLWFIFFGGEPLLEFETIREVVERVEATQWPAPAKTYHFMVETNATLLDEPMKQWFAAHREHLTLSVSMDGTKEAHDRNRSNSYDAVARHVEYLTRNWPSQPAKMTIGPDTIGQTYEGVVNLHRLGIKAEFDVLFEDVWGDAESESRYVRVWAEQLDRLVGFYAAHPELTRPSALSRKLERLFEPGADGYTFCGAGKQVTCYTPDERQYPCFRFAPLVVDTPLVDVLTAPDTRNELCAACPFARICTTCEGHNYAATGSCFHRTSFHCGFFQASLLATAKMMLRDEPVDAAEAPGNSWDAGQSKRMRQLLAIRLVNDVCAPAVR